MNNYHQYLPIATVFPTAATKGEDGYLHLKPSRVFMQEVIDFVWPVVLVYITSRVGWKAMRELFEALKGN